MFCSEVCGVLFGVGEGGEIGGKPLHSFRLMNGSRQGFLVGLEDTVEQTLEVALQGGDRGSEFVGDLGHEPDAALFGLVECCGEGVDVPGQCGELFLCWDWHAFCVRAGGEAPGHSADLVEGAEHAGGGDRRRGQSGQGADDRRPQQCPVEGSGDAVLELEGVSCGHAAHHRSHRSQVIVDEHRTQPPPGHQDDDHADHDHHEVGQEQPGPQRAEETFHLGAATNL